MSSASGVDPASPAVRVVRVKAVADEAFREDKGWAKQIREHFVWADEKLRELGGIGLELVAVEPWRTHEDSDMVLLLNELRAGVAKDGAEVVIGFTGHPPPAAMFLPGGPVRYPVPFAAGIAFSLGDRAVVRRTEEKKLVRHTLIHEIAHLFGGLHVADESILETDTHRLSLRLDPFNRRVLDLARDRDFDRGIREIPEGELAALVDLYREAPLRGEHEPDTAIRIAYLLMLAGEVEDALEEFRRAVQIAPEQSRNILQHAIIPELEAWAEEREPTERTRYVLAQAYSLAERWPDAAAMLRPGCAKPSGEDARSCELLGAVYLKSGELDLAERTLLTALRRDDSRAGAHRTLARVYAAAGRHDEALEAFGRAQELDPGDADTHFDTGLSYLAADKPGAAEASFREALRLREAHDEARAKLALALARQGRGAESRALLEPFEERRILSAFLLRDMAEVYFLSGDTEEAFESLQLAKKGGIDVQAVESLIQEGTPRPRVVEAVDLVEQAQAYYRTGGYDTARDLLGRALEEKPQEPRVHYWLGRVAAGEKDDERARGHFRRSLELDPAFLRSRYELGRLAYGIEDHAEVVSLLGPYVESGEAGSGAHTMLGRSQFELGNLREAEEHLRTAIGKRSDDGNAFYFLARVLLEQGRDEEARRELELAAGSRSLPDWRRQDAHLRLARLLAAAGEDDKATDHVGVALGLGAAGAASPGGDSPAASTDRVELVRVAPSLTRPLARGREVRIVSTVRFELRSADRGTVFLAPQDENGNTLVRPQPRAVVERGRGEVTLEATITTPASGSAVEVFVALHARGDRTTTAVTRARYTLE